jgi:hypothetical protein
MSDTFDILNFSTYKITYINAMCHPSSPCIHEVSILFLNENIKVNMSGDIIAKYYKYNKMSIPYHYNIYISEKSLLN